MENKRREEKFTMLSFQNLKATLGIEQKISFENMFKVFKGKSH